MIKLTQLYNEIRLMSSNMIFNGDLSPDVPNWEMYLHAKSLKVAGNLYLGNTKITRLPDNLKVGGYLDLYNTPITQLPNNLQVGGNLNLGNTKITRLPNNLQVGGKIYGYKGNSGIHKSKIINEIKLIGANQITPEKLFNLIINNNEYGEIVIKKEEIIRKYGKKEVEGLIFYGTMKWLKTLPQKTLILLYNDLLDLKI